MKYKSKINWPEQFEIINIIRTKTNIEMKATVEQMEEKYDDIEAHGHNMFLCEYYLKWADKNELNANELEEWINDETAIKKMLNYLDITEVRRIPFGIVVKVEDTIVMLSLCKCGESIEFVRTHI